jgi:hypothetical protein
MKTTPNGAARRARFEVESRVQGPAGAASSAAEMVLEALGLHQPALRIHVDLAVRRVLLTES